MTKKQKNKVIGYIRVSTVDQNTEKNKAAILDFANNKDFGKVEFVTEKISGMTGWKNRKLNGVVEQLHKNDIIIVPELSRLGRSIANVLEVLNVLAEKGVKVYSVKENFQLNGSTMQDKVMRTMLSLFAELENDIRSARILEGQKAAREQGRVGGRRVGFYFSKLDKHKDEIEGLLRMGVQKKLIAEKFRCNPATLHNFIKRNNLHKIEPEI